MNSQCTCSAQFFNRQDLSALQAMPLTQNEDLYCDQGMRSARNLRRGPLIKLCKEVGDSTERGQEGEEERAYC